MPRLGRRAVRPGATVVAVGDPLGLPDLPGPAGHDPLRRHRLRPVREHDEPERLPIGSAGSPRRREEHGAVAPPGEPDPPCTGGSSVPSPCPRGGPPGPEEVRPDPVVPTGRGVRTSHQLAAPVRRRQMASLPGGRTSGRWSPPCPSTLSHVGARVPGSGLRWRNGRSTFPRGSRQLHPGCRSPVVDRGAGPARAGRSRWRCASHRSVGVGGGARSPFRPPTADRRPGPDPGGTRPGAAPPGRGSRLVRRTAMVARRSAVIAAATSCAAHQST